MIPTIKTLLISVSSHPFADFCIIQRLLKPNSTYNPLASDKVHIAKLWNLFDIDQISKKKFAEIFVVWNRYVDSSLYSNAFVTFPMGLFLLPYWLQRWFVPFAFAGSQLTCSFMEWRREELLLVRWIPKDGFGLICMRRGRIRRLWNGWRRLVAWPLCYNGRVGALQAVGVSGNFRNNL